MGDERRNRDFSKGPVRDETTSRWRVEVRYPDGSRVRKRFRRERGALLAWAAEQTKVENGTWNERAARNVTVAAAFERSRRFSKVQHRSYRSYIAPSLTLWEAHLRPSTLLARVTPAHIEDFKLARVEAVARSTADKDLAILNTVR